MKAISDELQEEIKEALNKTNICHYDKLEVLNNLKK